MEDDLEDAQDDVKKAKNKLDASKAENSGLREKLQNIEDEHENIKKTLDNTQGKLKLAHGDLELKNKSLGFVNEILEAPKAGGRAVEIEEKTNNIVRFVNDSVCDSFRNEYGDEGRKIAKDIESEIWKWANLQRKTWLNGKVIIAFIGEFSAGKTSIVNRIFTRDKANAAFTLPTFRGATPAVATYISYRAM
jgi:septin family protein